MKRNTVWKNSKENERKETQLEEMFAVTAYCYYYFCHEFCVKPPPKIVKSLLLIFPNFRVGNPEVDWAKHQNLIGGKNQNVHLPWSA